MDAAAPLTPLQLELLKAYAFDPTEEELRQVKVSLATIFANRLKTRITQAVQEMGISQTDMDKWLNDDAQ
jgi:hypothetical protein